MGNHVLCLDVDRCKIELLNAGGLPIHEPGLEPVVLRNAAAGRLQFTTDVAASVAHGTLQFIGVGTRRRVRTARPTCVRAGRCAQHRPPHLRRWPPRHGRLGGRPPAAGAGPPNVVTVTHAELDLTDQAAVNAFFAANRIKDVVLAAAKVGGIHANDTPTRPSSSTRSW